MIVVESSFKKLPDGLLVTGKQSVQAIATEYTLLVLISEPQYPVSLGRNIGKLRNAIKRAEPIRLSVFQI